MPLTIKRQLGNRAEKLAYRYLKKHGLKLVCKNYTCRCGEIDLIMRDQDYLVFIEVRMRSNAQVIDALQSVGYRKQQRIICSAHYYLQQQRLFDEINCRFDVIAVSLASGKHIEWVQNAFSIDF